MKASKVKAIVLKNTQNDIASDFTRLIDKAKSKEQFGSDEITPDQFKIQAYSEVINMLLDKAKSYNDLIIHIARTGKL
jgi:hypothetical protein